MIPHRQTWHAIIYSMIENYWLIELGCLFNENGTADQSSLDFINSLEENSRGYLILTDKTTGSSESIANALRQIGYRHIREEYIYTSLTAAIDSIAARCPQKNKAGYLGGKGMMQTLRDAGFLLDGSTADWVFIGTDRNAAFSDYAYLLSLINKGASLIELDSSPRELYRGEWVPGPGAVVSMLEKASGKKAVSFAQPCKISIQRAMRRLNALKDETILITDSLDKGVCAGIQAQIKTAWLMKDEAMPDNLLKADIKPTYVIHDLGGLMR